MKRIIFIYFILVLTILTACSAHTEPDQLDKMAAQIEQVLPSEAVKQYETEVYPAVFACGNGATIEYYLCLTTYYAADPDSVTGLHLDAIRAVFDVDSAELLREFDAHGHAAAIYRLGDWDYICCTTNPEGSVVMVYDPEVFSQEDMIRSVRSIYVPDSGT